MNFNVMPSVQNHSDLFFWEIAIPMMTVIIILFFWTDFGRMANRLKKMIQNRKIDKVSTGPPFLSSLKVYMTVDATHPSSRKHRYTNASFPLTLTHQLSWDSCILCSLIPGSHVQFLLAAASNL